MSFTQAILQVELSQRSWHAEKSQDVRIIQKTELQMTLYFNHKWEHCKIYFIFIKLLSAPDLSSMKVSEKNVYLEGLLEIQI